MCVCVLACHLVNHGDSALCLVTCSQHIDAAAFNRIERLIISPPAPTASSPVQSQAQQMIIKTQAEKIDSKR